MYALYFAVILQHRSFPHLLSVTLSLGLHFCGSSSVSHSSCVHNWSWCSSWCVLLCSAQSSHNMRLHTAQQAGALSAAIHWCNSKCVLHMTALRSVQYCTMFVSINVRLLLANHNKLLSLLVLVQWYVLL